MAIAVSLNNVANLQDTTTAQTTINNNSSAITTALQDGLSRSGNSPNTMSAAIDMNGNRLMNVSAPGGPTEPVRQADLTTNTTLSFGGPTALVGTSPISGSASTAAHSDSAPAINQAMSPTWTGTHTFSNAIVANGGVTVPGGNSTVPIAAIYGGRLTTTTATPVLTANSTAQANLFYTPYTSNLIPIYNGTNVNSYTYVEQQIVLDAVNVTSGNVYDCFMALNAGVPDLGYGPAWTNATTRSAGTALARVAGIWTNNTSITLRSASGTTFGPIAANQATYVGSFFATANGQSGMAFTSAGAGGGAGVLGIYNAQNKVRISAYETDSNAGPSTGWSTAVTAWRSADGNSNNKISYLDGLGDTHVAGKYYCNVQSSSTDTALIGISRDYSSGTPTFAATQGYAATSGEGRLQIVDGVFLPTLGFHNIGAQEVTANASTIAFANNGGTITPAVPAGTYQKLQIELWI